MSKEVNDLKASGTPWSKACWPFNNIVHQLYQFLQSPALEPLKHTKPDDTMMSQWHMLLNVCLNQAFPEKLRHERNGGENRPTAACIRDLVEKELNFLMYCGQDGRMTFTVLLALAILIDEDELGLHDN